MTIQVLEDEVDDKMAPTPDFTGTQARPASWAPTRTKTTTLRTPTDENDDVKASKDEEQDEEEDEIN